MTVLWIFAILVFVGVPVFTVVLAAIIYRRNGRQFVDPASRRTTMNDEIERGRYQTFNSPGPKI